MTGLEDFVVPPLDDPDDDVLLPPVAEEPELDDPPDPEEEPLDPEEAEEEEPLDPEEVEEEELPPLLVEPPELALDELDDPAFFFVLDFDFALVLPDVSPPWPLPPEPPLPLCEPDAPPVES
jgi:hypothetical protein